MDRELCKLTLVYPVAAEDRVLDFLLDSAPPLPGFTSWRAEGHGASFEGSSTREKVRGRIERNMLAMVLDRARLADLLAGLRAGCAIPDLAYWVERVESFGIFK
ncbi:DUF3240 family protein [uncultured Rhodoblastus sp.]|uniref:DUF3240 family protein n=1 Tax=uncultured Rhodoblastus sp. TaxID=543037 RepID=UPI0025FF6681|nr:DUF3240 family protein [uncultured Rhodoblastus sp.]